MAAKICRVVRNLPEHDDYRPDQPTFFIQALARDGGGSDVSWSDDLDQFQEYPTHGIADERAAEIGRVLKIRCHAHSIPRRENELPVVETLPPATVTPMLPLEERKTRPAKPARKFDRLETMRRLSRKSKKKQEKQLAGEPTKPGWWKAGQYA